MAKIGALNTIADVPGLAVGCAHDAKVRTGVTVIVPDEAAVCAVDVRGGGPGARETDALAPENLVDAVHALVLSGGSVYGLGAADAVTAALGARGRGFPMRPGLPVAPVVPAAILFDLGNGGDKGWGETPPYARLGREALGAVGGPVPLGNAGAGYGALAGGLKGGQGGASVVADEGYTVAALTAVNCHGSPLIPGTRCFWAWALEQEGEFGGVRPPGDVAVRPGDWGLAKGAAAPRGNTTLAVVATDLALTPAQAKRIAQMASAGFAQAIRPVFTPFDGDIVFVLSTAKRALPDPAPAALARLGAHGADCVARAVARGVAHAESLGEATAWRDLRV